MTPTDNTAAVAIGTPETSPATAELEAAIAALLPSHYQFEIEKTIRMIQKQKAQRVALQMPEGLLLFATSIATLLERFGPTQADGHHAVETVIMGDVTYGACCVDDFTAKALGCDLLVHYGHSCLVPVTTTSVPVLYVFVTIAFDVDHLVRTLRTHFQTDTPLYMVSTIQFASALDPVRSQMQAEGYTLTLPQSRPLSRGEILGCTAPKVADTSCIVYVGDGRFHLEAMMLANPVPTAAGRVYRYDPYTRKFTREYYEHQRTMGARRKAVMRARALMQDGRKCVVGVVWGTLGRQGSPAVVQMLKEKMKPGVQVVTVLLSELSPEKVASMKEVDMWIQTSCPRLSLDWGEGFTEKPLLTPYEGVLAFMSDEEFIRCRPGWMKAEGEEGEEAQAEEGNGELSDGQKPSSDRMPRHDLYPMDFYARDSLGPWTPNHKPRKDKASDSSSNAGILSWKERLAQRRIERHSSERCDTEARPDAARS